MICCADCFNDREVRAAIELVGNKGNCPICGELDTWIYDSSLGEDVSSIEDMLVSILEIYGKRSKTRRSDTVPILRYDIRSLFI